MDDEQYIDLRAIGDSSSRWEVLETIFSVFREVLLDPSTSGDAKASLIADQVLRLWRSKDNEKDRSKFVWNFWDLVYHELIYRLPVGNPWQQVLVDVVIDLRDRGRGSDLDDTDLAEWAKFDDLRILLFDFLAQSDPFRYSDLGQVPEESDVTEWMREHSFIARLTGRLSPDEVKWAPLPLREIREALEEDVDKKQAKAIDGRLWVCTEWLIHAPRVLHDYICDEAKEPNTPNDTTLGSLALHLPEWKEERWNFWITRLKAMRGRSEELDQRIAEAIQSMENVKTAASQ